jgi:hypothetical protein
MSLKDMAFLVKWAKNNRLLVEVIATNMHRQIFDIDSILHDLERSLLKKIQEDESPKKEAKKSPDEITYVKPVMGGIRK